MKYNKKKGIYIPSETEILKAAAHARRLQKEREKSFIECLFYPEIGEFCYYEYTNIAWYQSGNDWINIPQVCGKSWARWYEQPDAIKRRIEKYEK